MSVDQYNAGTGQLTIGAVQVGAKVYTNVLLNIALSNVVSVAGYAEHEIHGFLGGTDGSDPVAGLVMDANGNLYGTTSGVASSSGGTVFKLTPANGGYQETVLYQFSNGADGGNPLGGVVLDSSGNLFGTTSGGGTAFSGTVFELASDGHGGYTESVLHTFANDADGSYPHAGLIRDAVGNLYGTTQFGGSASMATVFRLMPAEGGTYTVGVVYSFQGGSDGSNPEASLIFGTNGSLYGTTYGGGPHFGGIVFQLAPSGAGNYTEAVLYNFTGGADGGNPLAGLVLDASGNLFGTASTGGSVGGGTAFKLTPSGDVYSESVLHNFGMGVFEDGVGPVSGLILDAGGSLYGTASIGGTDGRGTVFKLTPSGSNYVESVLYNFPGSPDGNEPEASLLIDASGNLFGTTASGGPATAGSSYGAVFEIR